MKSISFVDLSQQVHLINDLILSDMMICVNDDSPEEAVNFRKHLLATKYWFARISCANKKRYVLALLENVRSAWTLSLLLKSLWNCRPKDAVMSVSEQHPWSSYDQVPMDHNRTALPVSTLAQVMKNDRIWFLTLEPEPQAMVLSELLTIAGGPVMWAVLKRAQMLYERYHDKKMQDLFECIVVNEPPQERGQQTSPEKVKKDPSPARKVSSAPGPEASRHTAPPGQAQKELEANLNAWNATIKSMKDSLKLEELEMIFNDGSKNKIWKVNRPKPEAIETVDFRMDDKRIKTIKTMKDILKLEELEMIFNDGSKNKIWKVNRPKPEAIETVDFIQLLPSSIGKRILSYLPPSQYSDCARVNKYWAFLVDEYRAEINTRSKLETELGKLQEIMLRYDTSMEMLEVQAGPSSSQGMTSVVAWTKAKGILPSTTTKASEKSGGAYSLRYFINEKLKQPAHVQRPIRNMAELFERLERRGAADEMTWKWCENIIKHVKKTKTEKLKNNADEGVIPSGNMHFPCPMMKHILQVPLNAPLTKDPANTLHPKHKRNIPNATIMHMPKDGGVKRYSLWTRNLSSLYPVFKIPSYQF